MKAISGLVRTQWDNEGDFQWYTLEERKKNHNENSTIVLYVEREEAIGQLEGTGHQAIPESSSFWFDANRGSILNNRRQSASRRRRRRCGGVLLQCHVTFTDYLLQKYIQEYFLRALQNFGYRNRLGHTYG